MDILKKSLLHDIEIFPNFFSDIFKVPGKNEIFITIIYDDNPTWDNIHKDLIMEIKNKLSEYEIRFRNLDSIITGLIKFKPYLIGYNNYHYDDVIWKYILSKKKAVSNSELFKLSKSLIEDNKNKLKYNNSITTIDLMRVSGCDRLFKPLKQTAANLKHNLIQDLPKNFDETVKPWEIAEILKYELNDVLITEKLLLGIPEHQKSITIPKTAYKGLLPAIAFRFEIGKLFNMDLYNNNKSQIGERLAKNLYSRSSGRNINEFKDSNTKRDLIDYSEVIFNNISFKTKELIEFLDKLKSLKYNPSLKPEKKNKKSKYMEQFYFTLKLFGLVIEFKQGGLHAVHETRKKFDSDKRKIDCDGTSYYPFIYTKYHVEPLHLNGFVDFVNYLISIRVDFKNKGNKVAANGIKIPINRIFGGYGDKTSWMYDEMALLKTTINGQLFLLMLIEELYINGIETFYANTDGITIEIEDNQIDKFNEICERWEKTTLMNLEYADYKKCFIRDVNNYIIVKEEGIKLKGVYEYTSYIEKYGEFDVTGSFEFPIVSYAVFKYLIDDIPIEETIKSHKDIYDFCIAKKTGKQFKNLLLEIDGINIKESIIQQSVRYFISKSKYKLYKIKNKSETELLSLLKKSDSSKKNEYFLTKKDYVEGYKHISKLSNGLNIFVTIQGELFKSPFKEWLSYTDRSVGQNISLFNKYYEVNWNDYNINYDFYIKESMKLINSLKVNTIINKNNNKQLKLF